MSGSELETPNEKVSFLRLFLDKPSFIPFRTGMQKEAKEKVILKVPSFFSSPKKEK
jgi:hypothetical protein